jgi:hypothetical protein
MNSLGLKAFAISPTYFLNSSDRGALLGISTWKMFARKHAIASIKEQWSMLSLSNSTGVGGLFGKLQNKLFSLVLASRG